MTRMVFLNRALSVALVILVIGCAFGSFPTIVSASSPPASPPTHRSPISGATGVSLAPIFSWGAVSGATRYGLYIRDTSTGVLVFDSEARGIRLTGTSYTLPAGILRGGITYRWNMRAGNAAGWGPSFSSAWTFTTITPPTITTTSLPAGTARVSYKASLSASGGRTPYSFTRVGGSLPPGLTLSSGGVISGTPSSQGTFNFTVQVRDASSPAQTAQRALSITVNQAVSPLNVVTQALVNAQNNLNTTSGYVTWNGTTIKGIWADSDYTYCARFVRMCFGEFTPRFETAKQMYEHFNRLNLVNRGGNPPRGAVVFYGAHSENGNMGHVGIADGAGNIYSVVNKTNGVLLRPIGAFKASYLGYVTSADFKSYHMK